MLRRQRQPAGEAFLVGPSDGSRGPGVLILHSWWGLTDWVKDFATALADEGFTVLAPDLLEGEQPTTAAEGERILGEVSPDELSGLVLSSTQILQNAAQGEDSPVAVIGFSMGASMALWVSARLPDAVNKVVVFYGAQSIDFDDCKAEFLGHFAEIDDMVSEEDRVVTESFIRLGDNESTFHVYPGTRHWFFEQGDRESSGHYDAEAAALAHQRTLDFLES